MEDKTERKRNRIIALILFIVATATYLKTVSPSVPFWDCGEFIATSHIMGVPHPPGAPLFILVGRFFILFLPFIQEVALRVNLISVLFCALAVAFFYLCAVRIISRWLKPIDSVEKRIILYTGAIVGSLFMTFSATYWFNATEAEVYGIAMFFTTFVCWLMLLWAERYQERDSDRFLFLIVYLLFLGITNHMTVFLVGPPVFLYVFLTDKEKLYDWKFWTLGILLSTILFSIMVFIVLSGLALIGTLFVMFASPRQSNYSWKYLGLAFLIAIVGYSTYIYVPIRAKLAPSINENNPDNWGRYKMFMERKQYGQESMVTRMFKRRGSWANQFGDHRRMGFWYFFKNQYMRKELWFIPVLLGLFGMVYHWKRDRKTAVFTLSLFLTFSLLLLIYINFSDGTRADHLEVRDRDYFYTQAYAFYPLWLGIGAVGILEWLRSRWKAKKAMLSCGAVFFIALSCVPFFENYHVHDRTGNYIAHDYAYNILISCEPDAILFTNGDNDTFPLWFLQEVKNIRKDVRVVNLSLLNTPWYIKQLRDYEPKIPVDLTDKYIDEKLAVTDPSRLFQEPTKKVSVGGLTWDLKPSRDVTYQGTKYGYLTVQDMMVMRIIEQVKWKQPIYFAVTVSPENKINLDKYLRMEGLVLRVVQEEGLQQLDPDKSQHNLWDLYLYRGVNDPKIYKDDQTMKLLSNYQASYVYLAQILMQEGRNEEAVRQLQRLEELVPTDDWRTSMFTAQLYSNMRKYAEAAEYTKKALTLNPGFTQGKLNLPVLFERAGKIEEAIQEYKDLIEENPNLGQAYTGLADVYAKQQDHQQAVDVLKGWLARNPNDTKAKNKLTQYEQALAQPAPAPTDTTP